MKISVPKETHPGEARAPLTPDSTAKLVKLGAQVEVEAGLGLAAGFHDDAYQKAGATVAADRRALLASGDLVLRLRKPPGEEVPLLKPNSIHVSNIWPLRLSKSVSSKPWAWAWAYASENIP